MSKKEKISAIKMQKNLILWADVTATCIELRKAMLIIKTGMDEREAEREVFREFIRDKEQRWQEEKTS